MFEKILRFCSPTGVQRLTDHIYYFIKLNAMFCLLTLPFQILGILLQLNYATSPFFILAMLTAIPNVMVIFEQYQSPRNNFTLKAYLNQYLSFFKETYSWGVFFIGGLLLFVFEMRIIFFHVALRYIFPLFAFFSLMLIGSGIYHLFFKAVKPEERLGIFELCFFSWKQAMYTVLSSSLAIFWFLSVCYFPFFSLAIGNSFFWYLIFRVLKAGAAKIEIRDY